MSLFVLDTDVLTLYQEGDAVVRSHALQHSTQDIATTVLNVEEQVSGWYTLVRQAKQRDDLAWAYSRLAASVRFLAQLAILDFTKAAIDRYQQLRRSKIKIGRLDLC